MDILSRKDTAKRGNPTVADALQVQSDLSEGAAALLDVLRPLGLRGTLTEDTPGPTRAAGTARVKIVTPDQDVLRVSARLDDGTDRERTIFTFATADLSNETEDVHLDRDFRLERYGTTYASDLQAMVRSAILTRAMHAEAARFGEGVRIRVDSLPRESSWRRWDDPERAQKSVLEFDSEDGDTACICLVEEGDLVVEVNSNEERGEYLTGLVARDALGRIGQDSSTPHPAEHLKGELTDLTRAAYESALYRRSFAA